MGAESERARYVFKSGDPQGRTDMPCRMIDTMESILCESILCESILCESPLNRGTGGSFVSRLACSHAHA